MAYKICQSRFKSMTNIKFTLKELPKTLRTLPNWRIFSKSGHTGWSQRKSYQWGPYPFNDGGVADCQAVEEVHQDDDDEEHEGQEEQVTEHGANFALLKRVELT